MWSDVVQPAPFAHDTSRCLLETFDDQSRSLTTGVLIVSGTRSARQQWSSSYVVTAHVPAHRQRLSVVVMAVTIKLVVGF